MRHRQVAIGFLLISVLGVLIVLGLEGIGPITAPSARHLRAMKDRAQAPTVIEDISFDDFVRLPAHPTREVRDSLEGRGVRLEGYVQSIRRAPDGDFHLDVTLNALPSRGRDRHFLTAEITPPWRRIVPAWSYEALVRTFQARDSVAGPPRVRLTGWLLFDSYVGVLPRAIDPHGAGRLSSWEIHPITHVEVWDEHKKRMVEFPSASNRVSMGWRHRSGTSEIRQ